MKQGSTPAFAPHAEMLTFSFAVATHPPMTRIQDSESKLAWLLALAADDKPENVAETHGVVIGLLCARPGQNDDELATHLAAMQVGDWTQDTIHQRLGPALAVLRDELGAPDMSFRPLLPTDERPLEERTRCLAFWCGGFMAGFGAGGAQLKSDESNEALQCLERIARAATDADADAEEEEGAYMELTEFVRVAVLLLREECL